MSLRELLYPYEAWEKGNADKLLPYWENLADRDHWAYKMRGRRPFRGRYTFARPHEGGCRQFAHRPASERCCQQKTVAIPEGELLAMQGEIFGTPEWTLKYSSRSRIEACFSRLKSGDVTPYGRFWARFTDFGKNWLATLLAFVAVNMTEVESYLKRKALRDAGRDDGRKRRIERPRFTDFVRRAVVEPIVSRPAVVGTGPPDRGGGEVVRITSRRDRRRR
jgi:hypothetical protein